MGILLHCYGQFLHKDTQIKIKLPLHPLFYKCSFTCLAWDDIYSKAYNLQGSPGLRIWQSLSSCPGIISTPHLI